MSFEERKALIAPISTYLKIHEKSFTDVLIEEAKIPRTEAQESHKNIIQRIEKIMHVAKPYLVTQAYENGITNTLIREAYGTILIITPSNHPVSISLWQIIPALLAGNKVIYKPSEYAFKSAKLISDTIAQLKLPPRVFQTIYEDYTCIPRILEKEQVDLIIFTGSLVAGRQVNMLAAQHMIPTIMELGGKDAIIIREDADIKSATDAIIVGCLRHSGQLCSSIERVYLHKNIEQEIIIKLKEKLEAITVGHPNEKDTIVTELLRPQAYHRIRKQITQAQKSGATLEYGNLQESYKGPWMLSNTPNNSQLFQEETFGPVIATRKFQDDEEVAKEVNNNKYGLCATIWSTSKTDILAQKLDVGTVCTNRLSGTLTHSPWLGRKNSGIGHILGIDPLEPYTTYKNIREKK